jgi:hypothetical protein
MSFLVFADAQAACGPNEVVAGTYGPDGVPVYTVVGTEADEFEVTRVAFKAKHGRSMNEAEELIEREARKLLSR